MTTPELNAEAKALCHALEIPATEGTVYVIADRFASILARRSVPVASEDVADLIERLKTGCVCIGSDEDNPGVELYDVDGASDTMAEAAEVLTAALSGQTAVPVAVKPLKDALSAILAEPCGCVFCDSGKLRNPAKPHEPDCGFFLAEQVMDTYQILGDQTKRVSLPHKPIVTPVSPAPDAGWREAFDAMLGTVQAIIYWADRKCPCHNEEPNPCPLCGASIENLEGCKAADATLPRALLTQIRAAISKAQAAGGKA